MYEHNRHLIGVISQIMEEGLNEELIHMLCIELKFATVNSINHRGTPLYIKRNGRLYLMLYLVHDEMMDHYPDWPHSHFSFGWFMEIISCPAYFWIDEKNNSISPCEDFQTSNGIIFMIGEDEFIVEGELLARLREFFEIDLYSVDEMKSKFDNIDNAELESLLSESPLDWDEIIRKMTDSTMLYLIDVSDKTDYEDIDLFFDFLRFDVFGCGRQISLFTTPDVPDYQYAVIVNVKKAVDNALNFGLPGITIRTGNDEVFMSRNLIIEKYELIGECCDDKRLRQSHEFLFKL